MITQLSNQALLQLKHATRIPALSHREAGKLATIEADRLLTQIENLTESDWSQPTDCSEWDVRALVSHLAGAVAGHASWAEFKRQNIINPYLKSARQKIDSINRKQVEDRAEATPAKLVAEFRDKAPRAIHNRQRLPWLLRALHLPLGPPLGFTSIGYMMDTIYTRDQWMHRLDLAGAASQTLILTPEHDGRIVDLVILDLGKKLRRLLQGRTIDLILDGQITASYRFGQGQQADATIEMDMIEFNRLASGRISPDAAQQQATIHGDPDAAAWFFYRAEIPY